MNEVFVKNIFRQTVTTIPRQTDILRKQDRKHTKLDDADVENHTETPKQQKLTESNNIRTYKHCQMERSVHGKTFQSLPNMLLGGSIIAKKIIDKGKMKNHIQTRDTSI